MRKLKIALEGPINGCSNEECVAWRDRVKAELGDRFEYHDPMDFDCRGREQDLEQELVDFDEAGITSSDILIVNGPKPGWGTAMGVQMGYAQGKHIVTIFGGTAPSPWLSNRSSKIVSTVSEAILYVIDFVEA